MMFGSKPSYLLLVQRNAVVLQNRQAKGSKLTLEVKLVRNLEIVDRPALLSKLTTFLGAVKNQRVLVVMDRSVVFDKTIDDAEHVVPTEAVRLFTAALPFEPARRAVISTHAARQLQLFGTNNDLVHVLIEALEAVAAKAIAVVPLAAYGKPQTLSKQGVVAHLLDDRHTAEVLNFIKQ